MKTIEGGTVLERKVIHLTFVKNIHTTAASRWEARRRRLTNTQRWQETDAQDFYRDRLWPMADSDFALVIAIVVGLCLAGVLTALLSSRLAGGGQ